MNLSPAQKKWIAWILVFVVVTSVNLYFGLSYPIPEPPVDLAAANSLIVADDAFTATEPLTVTGVLTNVVLLYEQQ